MKARITKIEKRCYFNFPGFLLFMFYKHATLTNATIILSTTTFKNGCVNKIFNLKIFQPNLLLTTVKNV